MAVESLSKLLDSFAAERTGKLGAGENALRQIIGLFDKGTGNMRNELADVNENLISRGLGSTTRPAVASVGMKAKYEDIRKTRLADALSALANYLGQTAPTAPTVSNLAMGTNQVLRETGAVPNRIPIPQTLSQRWYSTPGNIGAYTGA